MTHQHSSMVPTLPVPLSLKLQHESTVVWDSERDKEHPHFGPWCLSSVTPVEWLLGMAKREFFWLINPLRLVHPKRAIICWFLPSQILPWSLRLGMEDRNPLLKSLEECGLEAWVKGLSRLLCLLRGLTPLWLTLQRGYVRCFMYEYLWFCVQGKDLRDFKS